MYAPVPGYPGQGSADAQQIQQPSVPGTTQPQPGVYQPNNPVQVAPGVAPAPTHVEMGAAGAPGPAGVCGPGVGAPAGAGAIGVGTAQCPPSQGVPVTTEQPPLYPGGANDRSLGANNPLLQHQQPTAVTEQPMVDPAVQPTVATDPSGVPTINIENENSNQNQLSNQVKCAGGGVAGNFEIGDWKNRIVWDIPFCGCCLNMPVCCATMCCCPCMMFYISVLVGEGCATPCLGICCGYPLCCGPITLLRNKVRIYHGIEGSIGDDAIISCICPLCVMCQMHNQWLYGNFLKAGRIVPIERLPLNRQLFRLCPCWLQPTEADMVCNQVQGEKGKEAEPFVPKTSLQICQGCLCHPCPGRRQLAGMDTNQTQGDGEEPPPIYVKSPLEEWCECVCFVCMAPPYRYPSDDMVCNQKQV